MVSGHVVNTTWALRPHRHTRQQHRWFDLDARFLDITDEDFTAHVDWFDLGVGLIIMRQRSPSSDRYGTSRPTRSSRRSTSTSRPLRLGHGFGRFRARGRDGILLRRQGGGLEGMVRVANYAATKAYNLVLAEGLWAELREDGVDVLVSCAGATRTPNYVASAPDGRQRDAEPWRRNSPRRFASTPSPSVPSRPKACKAAWT